MEMTVATEVDNRLVLTCSGQMGWEDRDNLVQKVRESAGETGQFHLLMDLEAVEYINSAGIGALFQLVEMLGKRDGKLVLANVPPTLQKLFKTVALNRLAHMADTLDDARAFLDQPA